MKLYIMYKYTSPLFGEEIIGIDPYTVRLLIALYQNEYYSNILVYLE